MIQIIQEFIVKEGAKDQFELTYGPGGAWSKLFARSPGFRGITVMREEENPRRYLAIDIWDTEALREHALAERWAEYSDVVASFSEWTESMTELGTFQVLTEAIVRPGGRSRRRMPGGDRRRRHQGPR